MTWDLVYNTDSIVLNVLGDMPALTGDYNGDGVVDGTDYTVWRETLGSTSDLRANGDSTDASDGIIDSADFNAWRDGYGNSVAAVSTTTPEPISAALLLVLVVVVIISRRS